MSNAQGKRRLGGGGAPDIGGGAGIVAREGGKMRQMRPYIAYIPILVVTVPWVVMAVGTYHSSGFFQGVGYFMAAVAAGVVGGILNIAYLAYLVVTGQRFYNPEPGWRANVENWGTAICCGLFALQVAGALAYVWDRFFA
jgi:hypothetical protein